MSLVDHALLILAAWFAICGFMIPVEFPVVARRCVYTSLVCLALYALTLVI